MEIELKEIFEGEKFEEQIQSRKRKRDLKDRPSLQPMCRKNISLTSSCSMRPKGML